MTAKRIILMIVTLLVGVVVGHRTRPAPVRPQPAARPAYDHYAALDRPQREILIDERQPFLQKYGKAKYSSHDEELFIRDFFQDAREGFFLDIGANHYRERNNTYYLESELGWSGIAVEPLVQFAAGYKEHRPRTIFVPMFVSDKSDVHATLYIGKNPTFSSGHPSFTEGFSDIAREVQVPTITLNDLLKAQKVTRLDFVSIDIELHEPQALAGFDIKLYRPRLLCVEAQPEVRSAVLDYFYRRGYIVVSEYLRADPQNLWFRPLD